MRRARWALAAALLIGCGDAASTLPSAGSPGSSTVSGSDAASNDSSGGGTEPIVYVDDRGVTVTITSTERIIPIDGDVAEIVFALGLGDRVVATDLSATHPPEADALPQIGYQRALNAEPILEFDPTVVIGTDTAGPPATIDALERVGVPVAIVPTPADPSGPGVKIRAVAAVLGVPEEGERLAAAVESEIAAATPVDPATSPLAGLRVAMIYLRGTDVQLVFGDGTGIDWLIEATGATDIADELGIVDTAELTAEAITAAAPDVLLVTEDGLASVGGVDGLFALPSLAGTPAAAHHAVLAYDAQLMLGNGPRTGSFLAALIHDLTDLRNRLDTRQGDSVSLDTPTTDRPAGNADQHLASLTVHGDTGSFPSHAELVRTLLAAGRFGALTTITAGGHAEAGLPFGSWVAYSALADGSPLVCISDLAEHTRNARADARAGLLVNGLPVDDAADPLDRPRVSLLGRLQQYQPSEEEVAAHAALHPGVLDYAHFADFGWWRLTVASARYVGGFGHMSWVTGEEIAAAEPDDVLAGSEAAVRHMNADHADACLEMVRHLGGLRSATSARVHSIDRRGITLYVAMAGDGAAADGAVRTVRVAFAGGPLSAADEIRPAVVALTHLARRVAEAAT